MDADILTAGHLRALLLRYACIWPSPVSIWHRSRCSFRLVCFSNATQELQIASRFPSRSVSFWSRWTLILPLGLLCLVSTNRLPLLLALLLLLNLQQTQSINQRVYTRPLPDRGILHSLRSGRKGIICRKCLFLVLPAECLKRGYTAQTRTLPSSWTWRWTRKR